MIAKAMKFSKKPAVIEAVLCSEAMDASATPGGIPDWLEEASEYGIVIFTDFGLLIKTLEGTMRAQPTDWIIRGIRGEIYPCRADIFAETYEPANEVIK